MQEHLRGGTTPLARFCTHSIIVRNEAIHWLSHKTWIAMAPAAYCEARIDSLEVVGRLRGLEPDCRGQGAAPSVWAGHR